MNKIILNKIYNMDCLTGLKTLPDESIDCCITSPPYWGLRDYRTATWEGGNAECDHIETLNKHAGQRADRNQEGYKKYYKDVCAKCGAKRIDLQFGLEKTPEEYVVKMVKVFSEVKRVLKKEGTLWLNLGDSYFSHQNSNRNGATDSLGGKIRGGGEYKTQKRESDILKQKDLCGIPWRVAFALQQDGWWLRQDIIWAKPNPMPESVTDRCTKAHEYIFLLTKNQKYYFDNEAIKESGCGNRSDGGNQRDTRITHGTGGGNSGLNAAKAKAKNDGGYFSRNKRSVWTVTTKPFKEAHFATFPPDLITPMILAGCREQGIVLDPFMGSGTTAYTAKRLNRNYIGFEINEKYIDMARERIASIPKSIVNWI